MWRMYKVDLDPALDELALWLRFYCMRNVLYVEGNYSPSGLLIGRNLDRVGVGLRVRQPGYHVDLKQFLNEGCLLS
jgi:hypothetical protein